MTVTLIRALLIYFTVILAMRIMGKRQIGELNPHELVITILVSQIASIPLQDNTMPLANAFLPMLLLVSLEILASVASMKSLRLRNLLQGRPIFLIRHGIEERGVYRIHQFEKQEMIVVCKPEESKMWFDKLWQNTVDLFRSLDIPVRTLECCSGDLADLKVKSVDVEAWSPRQKKYFEVGSCSNLSDAQARRLKIRVKGEHGNYLAHTLNNTVVAPPRMLIAFLENNLQADGSVLVPKALQPYMGGTERLVPKK